MRTVSVAILLCGIGFGALGEARAETAQAVIGHAAAALGGMEQVMSVRSLKIFGYGQMAYQDGGGNITSSPDAPQKWLNVDGYRRVIDLEHERTNVQQRNVEDFVFAFRRFMDGELLVDNSLDGDVAFGPDEDGRLVRASAAAARGRRIDMLDNPVSIVRAALDPAAKLGAPTLLDGSWVIDVTTPRGDALVLAVNATTWLPAWLGWTAPHNNFGDVTYRTYFTGYQPLDGHGLNLPSGYNTVSSFRNVVQQKLYVDKYEINTPIRDLSAPARIRADAAPVPGPPAVAAIPVAKGVWFLKVTPDGNSTLFEFADHLTLFELFGSEAQALAVIAKARATVPGKPVTQVIVSHFHIDHTGGLRAAVSEGLAVITNRQNADYVREVTSRPATVFPDALGRKPRAAHIIPVDDRLELADRSMTVDVYRVVNNSHYAEGLIAYVPRDRLVSQGDLVDPSWDLIWWGNSYPDTVKYWQLEVARDLPVHGDIHSYAEVMAALKLQTSNAQKLCAEVAAAHLSMQGCPVSNTLPE
jgi:hypothetical protein